MPMTRDSGRRAKRQDAKQGLVRKDARTAAKAASPTPIQDHPMTNKQTGTSGLVEVTQADRDEFAKLLDMQGGPNTMQSYVRMGQSDDHPGVQAFAKHRLASLSPVPVDEVELIRKAHAEGWEDGWCGATACPPVGFTAEAVEDDWQRSQSLAALTASRPSDDGWMPIETAPKDGSYFLFVGTNFDGGAAVVHWDSGLEWWTLDDGKNPEISLRNESRLLGWLPLPAALSSLVGEK